jgi:hypothetical protein
MRLAVIAAGLLIAGSSAQAAAKRVLYLTATYGFRHDSIETSVAVFQQIAQETGTLEIVHSEDISLITADKLRDFDAVYFFTSGELPLSDQQKTDLLAFVRQGKGFGGSHSATDTLYTWPEYGDLIGAYFDGHPWAQAASVDVEDPESPIVGHLAPGFRAEEEFYQFRAFSRDNVRVLLTLDTRSVDLAREGVNRTDGDFALTWIRKYGAGPVFYSAFGHFDTSFTSPPLRAMLKQALLWLTGQVESDATPRSGPSSPAPVVNGVRVVGGGPDAFAPGALIGITGVGLTSGSSLGAAAVPLPARLAGTHVEVNGVSAPLFSVKPGEVVAQLPSSAAVGQTAMLTVSSVNRASAAVPARIEATSPEIVAAGRAGNVLVLYAVGLGATEPALADGTAATGLAKTIVQPTVRVGGQAATVFYSGLAPGLVGVYQVNAIVPDGAASGVVIEAGGRVSDVFRLAN